MSIEDFYVPGGQTHQPISQGLAAGDAGARSFFPVCPGCADHDVCYKPQSGDEARTGATAGGYPTHCRRCGKPLADHNDGDCFDYLMAEVAQLRADLAQANQNYEWSITRGKIWVIEIEKLRAQVEAMHDTLEKIAKGETGFFEDSPKAVARAALDQAQPQ